MNSSNIDPRRTEALAYQIWERAGRPDGAHEEHWREAERQLREEEIGSSAAQLNGDVARLDGDSAEQPSRKDGRAQRR